MELDLLWHLIFRKKINEQEIWNKHFEKAPDVLLYLNFERNYLFRPRLSEISGVVFRGG